METVLLFINQNKKLFNIYIKMRYNLLLMILSILFISIGIANENSPKCNNKVEIKYVPMDVYDKLSMDEPYY